MADSNVVGFEFDPRNNNGIRNTYPTPGQWSNQFDSPHSQPSIGANANAIKPSQGPLDDPRIAFGPMNQRHPSRTQSQEQYGYSRAVGQQPPLPNTIPPQNNFQQQYTQHLMQQQAFAQQFQSQPVIINQTMNSEQSAQNTDQSNQNSWTFGDQISSGQQYSDQNAYAQQTTTQAFLPWASTSVNFLPQQTQFSAGMTNLDEAYMAMNGDLDGMTMNWQDLQTQYAYRRPDGLHDMPLGNQTFPTSPTDTSLEVRSLSSSDNGWTTIDFHQYEGSAPENQAIFNPSQTLHCRTLSDSSYSDVENLARLSWNSSLLDGPHPMSESPTSDGTGAFDLHDHVGVKEHMHIKQEKLPSPVLSTSTTLPIKIKSSRSPQRSSIQKISPPNRRQARKNSIKNAAKAPMKRPSPPIKVETEKRVGRRKGPLRPEQRKQAADIRKLGACLRCKFLKKTCDKGEPCQGCLPSHARLWQVPCTRIDIKEIAYFMKDWKADVNREHILHFSVDNIIEFAKTERSLYISHGYGHVLHVYAREIYVRDERVFGVDWVETYQDQPTEFSVNTAKMSLGVDGISEELLSEYLDRYIDDGYENFIEQYFEGTPFVTEMMITVYRYYMREPTPVLRKTLKFLLAYNLTQHVTYVEGLPVEEDFTGKIFNNTSKFSGKTVAPVMINFSVKIAMAKMWRELQKEILEELSSMYSSVYSKEKLRNWPTIFMVACILLAVWEEMQFDCHYRVQDKDEVNRFCNEMESIPVKVVVGLFHAISQKLPALQEWETRKHHTALNSNPAICDALTEVRHHVTRHDQYLRSRCDTKFDCTDFDSLSSKFMSKLVIRSPAA